MLDRFRCLVLHSRSIRYLMGIVVLGFWCSIAIGQSFEPQRVATSEDLHNVWQLSPRIYSGAEPESDSSFAELAKLGIRTVVSVDGLAPRVDLAKKYGMRMVHIPFGYDGIPEETRLALVRVAKEVPGKIYVHCHHGKHRGPAGAAILCRADDGRGVVAAREILEKAGTSREYSGLWRDVESFVLPDKSLPLPELVEARRTASLAATMAELDRTHDRLQLLARHGWTAPPEHADLSARQEATIFREHYAESVRLLGSRDTATSEALRSAFQQAFEQSRRLAEQVNAPNFDKSQASALLNQVQASCKDCHAKFRNTRS